MFQSNYYKVTFQSKHRKFLIKSTVDDYANPRRVRTPLQSIIAATCATNRQGRKVENFQRAEEINLNENIK